MTTGVGPTRSRQLCQDEVDGVPVFFVESAALPAPGRRLISNVRRFLRGPHAWIITAVVALALLFVVLETGRGFLAFLVFSGLSVAAYREGRQGYDP